MFKNLFSRKGKDTKKKEGGAFASAPAMSGEAEAADEEFQLLSLHRRSFCHDPGTGTPQDRRTVAEAV